MTAAMLKLLKEGRKAGLTDELKESFGTVAGAGGAWILSPYYMVKVGKLDDGKVVSMEKLAAWHKQAKPRDEVDLSDLAEPGEKWCKTARELIDSYSEPLALEGERAAGRFNPELASMLLGVFEAAGEVPKLQVTQLPGAGNVKVLVLKSDHMEALLMGMAED